MNQYPSRLRGAARPVVALLLALAAVPAQSGVAAPARTIVVTTTAQSPGSPGDCTLGEAIQAANTDHAVDACPAGSGADTIVLPAGTYTLTTPINLGIGGTAFVISGTITLQGNVAMLVRGGPITNTLRFFYVSPLGHLTLDKLILKNGLAQGDDGGPGGGPSGPGEDGHLGQGGAIYNEGQLTLDGTVFIDNTAHGGAGGTGSSTGAPGPGGQGGLGLGGAISSLGTIVVTGSGAAFTGNQALGGAGGHGGSVSLAGAKGGDGGSSFGGGLSNLGSLTATGASLLFADNSAIGGAGGGGGVFTGPGGVGGAGQGGAVNNGSYLLFAQPGYVLIDNQALGGNGGLGGNLTSGSYAGAGRGGALYNSNTATLDGALFQQNRAAAAATAFAGFAGVGEGGALSTSLGAITLTHSSFISNTAQGSATLSGVGGQALGGGIDAGFGSSVYLADSLLRGNRVLTTTAPQGNPRQGGGLALSGVRAAIERTAIVSDSAATGGPISSVGGGVFVVGSKVWFTNTTVAANEADFGGGLSAQSSIITLTQLSLAGNVAALGGGGLQSSGAAVLTLRNDLIAGNGIDNCFGSGIGDGGGNLESANDCGLTQSTSFTNTAPLLGPLADNGGNTLTFPLLPHSPALDKAVAAFCPKTDQRGVPRPGGPACDIGAFELNFPVWLPLTRR